MKPTDSSVRWIEERPLGLTERLYLPLVLQGLTTTARHLVSKKVTVSFPEERPAVACFLCATACPAHCIDIVATESPWPDREKYPESFQIDELRCIFCGMCEEACPVDAIELTSLLDLTGKSREEMIFDKEKLLSVYDMTKDAEPMKSESMGGTL